MAGNTETQKIKTEIERIRAHLPFASLALAFGQPNDDAPEARQGRLSGCFAAAPPNGRYRAKLHTGRQQPLFSKAVGCAHQNPVTASLHAAARHKTNERLQGLTLYL